MISILTPSYHRDFERCKLLCESIDKRVTGYSNHYIIVNDDDFALFLPLKSEKRVIMKYSDVIPSRLKVIPRWFKQDFWVSWNARPLKGWHVQQIVKIAATAKLPEDRVCIVDSDMIFVKDTDLSSLDMLFYVQKNYIPRNKPIHQTWINTAYRVLGLGEPDYPVDDHIGSIIIWNKASVLGMIKRIEAKTGKEWSLALQRAYAFSEYLLYGYFVSSSQNDLATHTPTDQSICHIYWHGDPLNEERLKAFMRDIKPHQIAVGIQSFTDTPLELLRTLIK